LNGAKSTRFDAAVFWSSGMDALTGNDCAYTSFTAIGTIGGSPPNSDGLPNLEDPATDDSCGDMPGQTADFARICDLKIVCQDLSGGGDNNVRVASCTTYKVPGANTICSNTDPTTFLPGSPSKCKCEFTLFPIIIKNPPTITKTCAASDPAIITNMDGTTSVQWTVTVAITNNNVNTALNSWEVTDSPLDFDLPLSSASTDGGPIAAGATKTATRTITESIPSTQLLNDGFTDTVTLSTPDFADVTATATCPEICEFTATCAAASIDANCDAPPALTNPGDVFTIGPLPCGSPTLTSTDDGDKCLGTITRTYTVFDDLDGDGILDANEESATCVKTFIITDNFPLLTKPDDATLECPADFSTAKNGVATATDDCDDPNPTPGETDVYADGCGNTRILTRTWSVTDSCDQTTTAVQIITEEDNIPPAITCPANEDLNCASNLGNVPTIAVAVDACEGNITPVYNGCCFDFAGKTLDRTWTATDGCDNANSCTQENPLSPTCPTLLPLTP